MNRNFERIVGKLVPPRSTSLLSLSRPGTFRLPTVSGPGPRGFDFCSRILSSLPLFHESHPSSNLSISQWEEPLWGAPASQGIRAGKLKNYISLVRWGLLSLSLGTVLLLGLLSQHPVHGIKVKLRNFILSTVKHLTLWRLLQTPLKSSGGLLWWSSG